MPSCLASHRICELYCAIFFSIMYSICQQCLYVHLLFLCISHLSRSWENLEWKQGLLSSQCYLSMQISCWLQIAPQRRIQREMTSRIPPWGACSNLVGLYCSYLAYLALPCHLLRLDMLCVNASCFLSISDMWIMQCHVFQPVIIYVNYAPPWSQASYMWIISCHLFFHYVFHLSTICVYWTALHVYQPLEPVMEKSGVKTRSSEQAMVPVEAYISMVTGSSSEEDSETDDQSYIPPEVYALSGNVYISHIMHMVSCIA